MALRRHAMTIEEYFELDERDQDARYEYIDGRIVMLSGGTPDHAKVAANFIMAISGTLPDSCSVYTSDIHVQLSEDRYVHPDVAVSCDRRDQNQKKVIQYPSLIVEVLSPSTENYDRGLKRHYYQACPSIHEYVLVHAAHQWIEVYRRGTNDVWTIHDFMLDDDVALASIGVRFPLAKLYRNVEVEPLPELSEEH